MIADATEEQLRTVYTMRQIEARKAVHALRLAETEYIRRYRLNRMISIDPLLAQRRIAQIKKIVAEHFGHTLEEMDSMARHEPLATRRQLAMALAREHTDASLPDIARAFKRIDHNTISHAVQVIPGKLKTDPKLRIGHDSIQRKIKIAFLINEKPALARPGIDRLRAISAK